MSCGDLYYMYMAPQLTHQAILYGPIRLYYMAPSGYTIWPHQVILYGPIRLYYMAPSGYTIWPHQVILYGPIRLYHMAPSGYTTVYGPIRLYYMAPSGYTIWPHSLPIRFLKIDIYLMKGTGVDTEDIYHLCHVRRW